jgi:hypothetical protein
MKTEWTNSISKIQGITMKKIFYALMALMIFVFASCSKEDAKENTVCFAQCLLAKEHGQNFAQNNNEEQSIIDEKLNLILRGMGKQDSILNILGAELASANKQQDSTAPNSNCITQEAPAEMPHINSETQEAEPTPKPAPTAVAEETYDDKIPEIREKKSNFEEQAISGTIGAVLGAAGGFMAAQKMGCKRLDILIEYKLMQVCINSCGYNTEEKCSDAIMNMLCKEKLEEDVIEQRARSCDIRH